MLSHPSQALTLLLLAGLIAACDPAPDVDALDSSAAPGDLIELDDLAVIAPPPGESVWSEVFYDDGSTQQIIVHSTLDGLVYMEEPAAAEVQGDADRTASLPVDAASPAPCSDGAYSLMGFRWESTLRWYFHSGSTPSGLSVAEVEADLKAATSNITRSDNNCGLADQVSASHEYLGRKSKGVNITSAGGCSSSDGVNMVAFGDLPEGVLGVACVWFVGDVAKESDVRLNKVDHKWTTDPGSGSCSNRFGVEAVMTHERGHSFGLGHVGESTHGKLTMSTKTAPCQNSESSLGKGDVLGLRNLY